jgi:hypothetical protein
MCDGDGTWTYVVLVECLKLEQYLQEQ